MSGQNSEGTGARRRPAPAPSAAAKRSREDFPPIVLEVCSCGDPLPNPRAKWCSPGCWKRRDHRRPAEAKARRKNAQSRASRFSFSPLGVDGEGEDGRYTLLAACDEQGFRRWIEDRDGLTTEECLNFLVNLPARPFLFGFAFSYDVNMILGSLSGDELFTLAQWGKVYWGDWRIAHVPGKALIITHRPSRKSCTVWDLYPWIQSSFVRMLEDFELADEATLERIATMKDQRSDFASVSMDLIREYCLEECELLSKAVKMLLDLIVESGYKTNVFYSPGSLAASAMKVHEVNDYRLDGDGGVLNDALEEGYVGARAEVAVVGPIEGG